MTRKKRESSESQQNRLYFIQHTIRIIQRNYLLISDIKTCTNSLKLVRCDYIILEIESSWWLSFLCWLSETERVLKTIKIQSRLFATSNDPIHLYSSTVSSFRSIEDQLKTSQKFWRPKLNTALHLGLEVQFDPYKWWLIESKDAMIQQRFQHFDRKICSSLSVRHMTKWTHLLSYPYCLFSHPDSRSLSQQPLFLLKTFSNRCFWTWTIIQPMWFQSTKPIRLRRSQRSWYLVEIESLEHEGRRLKKWISNGKRQKVQSRAKHKTSMRRSANFGHLSNSPTLKRLVRSPIASNPTKIQLIPLTESWV